MLLMRLIENHNHECKNLIMNFNQESKNLIKNFNHEWKKKILILANLKFQNSKGKKAPSALIFFIVNI